MQEQDKKRFMCGKDGKRYETTYPLDEYDYPKDRCKNGGFEFDRVKWKHIRF